MCARRAQDVCKVCARYVQDVCKVCARCVQGVFNMCARCMHMSCLISLNPTHLENIAHVGSFKYFVCVFVNLCICVFYIWYTEMSYLISLYHMLFKNIAHVGSFKCCVFAYFFVQYMCKMWTFLLLAWWLVSEKRASGRTVSKGAPMEHCSMAPKRTPIIYINSAHH